MKGKTITAAVKGLRRELGDTQQQFANRLGLAISSVVRYEAGKVPETAVLVKLAAVAEKGGYADLFRILRGAVIQDVGLVAFNHATDIRLHLLHARKELLDVPEWKNIQQIVRAFEHLHEADLLIAAMDPFAEPSA